MRKRRKIVFAILVVAISLSTSCEGKNAQEKNALEQAGIVNKEEDKTIAETGDKEKDIEIDDGALKETAINKIGDTLKIEDIDALNMKNVSLAFTVDDAYIGHEFGKGKLGDYEKELIRERGITLSDTDELEEDYFYLLLEVRVKNLQTYEVTWAINEYQIIVLEEDGTLGDNIYESIYWDGQIPAEDSGDGLKYTLAANEEKIFEIGFVVSKEDVGKNLVYFLSLTPPWEQNEFNKMVLVSENGR